MAIAESLYNKGLISYPRTETTVYHPTMFLKNFVKNLTGYPVLGKHAEKLMIEGNFQGPRKGTHDDKSHPPIHPVAFIQDIFDKLS
mgnify:CR=1 FL=1